MSPKPSPDHVDTKKEIFTSPSMRVLTQYYSVLSKKHQYYPNTPTSTDIYKERLQSNIDTSCNGQVVVVVVVPKR